jgi:hypothetical protein
MINARPGRWAALLGAVLLTAAAAVRDHGARLGARARAEPDRGYTTEFILITSLLVAIVVGVVAVLGKKIWTLVNGLQL